MSADSWARCPRCGGRQDKAKAEREALLAEAYLTMTARDYDIFEAANPPTQEDAETVREDWEMGLLDDGKFYANYKGRCQKCDFHHEFKHEERVK